MGDLLIHNISQLVTAAGEEISAEKRLGLRENCSLVIEAGRVRWLGSPGDLPERFKDFPPIDAQNSLVTPGLVDPHTHAVYAGSREAEYTQRALGKSYMEIAAAGGGIKATVAATRAASAEQLYQESEKRLLRMMQSGSSVIEVKSGYGLDLDTELRQLEVIKALNDSLPIELVPTFMGAHEIPPEYLKDGDTPLRSLTEKYLDFVIEKVLPEVADKKLAVFCDVFCEKGVFNKEQSRRLLQAAKQHGLKPKIHAEELSLHGGSELAAEIRAISADHLTEIIPSTIEKMQKAGVVFVLLPGTTAFLGHTKFAPARDILNSGGAVALATDKNPGSCTAESQVLMASLAVSFMKMTPAEALLAITADAAKALCKEREVGKLEIGQRGDAAIFDCKDYQELSYSFGVNLLRNLICSGEVVIER